jgi:hypothetical protein
MKEEVHEMHEHAHAAQHDPSLVPITITMSILAVMVAVTSLFGHRSHTEELLLQNKVTDNWAFYQAKNIRKHSNEEIADLLSVADLKDPELGEKLKENYKKEAERYSEEQKEIETEARELENETVSERQKANRFDLGEILLEAALVITSITLLTKWRAFWFTGIVLGLVGIVIASTGFFIY